MTKKILDLKELEKKIALLKQIHSSNKVDISELASEMDIKKTEMMDWINNHRTFFTLEYDRKGLAIIKFSNFNTNKI